MLLIRIKCMSKLNGLAMMKAHTQQGETKQLFVNAIDLNNFLAITLIKTNFRSKYNEAGMMQEQT